MRLFEPHARFESREHRELMILSGSQVLLLRNEWRPNLGIGNKAKRWFGRHHADNDVGLAIQCDALSNHRWIAAELFAPQGIAEDDTVAARLHIGRSEGPAVQRSNTQDREELL